MRGLADGATAPRLAFKPHMRAEVAGGAVYLFSEAGVTALHGSRIASLAPLLAGTGDVAAVLADGEATNHPAVQLDLARLREAGLLTERGDHDDPVTAPEQAYWELAGLDGPTALRRLGAARVEVLATGPSSQSGLREALTGSGLQVVIPGEPQADLSLVLCSDYLDPQLAQVDRDCRAAGRPWLPARLCGTELWLGPVFQPGHGPCLTCLTDPLWRNRPVDAHVQHLLGRSGPVPRPPAALPPTQSLGIHLVVLEAMKWLAGYRYPGQEQLLIIDTRGMTSSRHAVRRRPQCPVCGDPNLVSARVQQPVVLHPRSKQDTGGGHRALTPEQVMDRFGHLVDPVTGLVREIRRDERGPEFLNCFHAGHNPVRGPQDLHTLRIGLRSTSSGKGTTPLQARVSALGEALERHSGFHQGDEPRVRASYQELGPVAAVHPDTVQLFSPEQFRDRDRWNTTHGPLHQVCDPFDETARIDWSPVWSMSAGRHRLIPTALLYYNTPQPPGPRYCWANSNGAAAGGTLEDAVLQGFLELVERDAVALWWYNRTRQAQVRLDAFDDPWIEKIPGAYRQLHREVWALDLTSDLGIPVVAAVSRLVDGPAENILLGFGAHFDRQLALRRALTELNQMMPPVVVADRPGSGYGCDDQETVLWLTTATCENQPYLVPDPDLPAAGPAGETTARRDLMEDIHVARDLVHDAGLELLVLDQTRPDVGLPVVKVIVPGLRPHWARYAPGRLFDVPVRLGRLPRPTTYGELNPVPLFL